MKSKTILKYLFIPLIMIGIISCKEKKESTKQTVDNKIEVGVFNFDNKQELSKYNVLNLDETHPNLLNPQISKSDYNSVIKSWTDLHQRIGKYLSENRFDWEVKDSSITIVQKIYFNSDGEIENYFFNVLNKTVTKQKKEQFADLILSFANNNNIDFESERKFAQCGKTKYLNE